MTVCLPERLKEELRKAGENAPSEITGWAIIDTGAFKTTVDVTAARQAMLPVVDTDKISSASQRDVPCDVYSMKIACVPFVFDDHEAIGMNLSSGNVRSIASGNELIALIGRDCLKNGVLIYNGKSASFTLAA